MNVSDTIVAVATPAGTGALGVIRLSGSAAVDLADGIFRSCSGRRLRDRKGYTGMLGTVVEGDREIDEVIAYVYHGPKSYTGEDCVEFSCHGGSFLMQQVLSLCVRAGARPAERGEFTRRAFLNGRISLSQAEGVSRLIEAGGEAARRAAFAQKDGALSREIADMLSTLTALSAHFAAWADYPDEDMSPVEPETVLPELEQNLSKVTALLGTFERGKLIQEGIRTAIVGKPNVGKSTLMNLLSGTRRSIVTDIPGTTRDVVQETVRMGDYQLCLLDTAGIRDTMDPVEKQGVRMARDEIQSAHLVLAVFDRSEALDENDGELMLLIQEVPCIAVVNKSDLPSRIDLESLQERFSAVVTISAQSGEGREELERQILHLLRLDTMDPSVPVILNERQRHCLLDAKTALEEATEGLRSGMTLDAVNVSLDEALDALLRLTGERVSDRVVDEVFARFCVGK